MHYHNVPLQQSTGWIFTPHYKEESGQITYVYFVGKAVARKLFTGGTFEGKRQMVVVYWSRQWWLGMAVGLGISKAGGGQKWQRRTAIYVAVVTTMWKRQKGTVGLGHALMREEFVNRTY